MLHNGLGTYQRQKWRRVGCGREEIHKRALHRRVLRRLRSCLCRDSLVKEKASAFSALPVFFAFFPGVRSLCKPFRSYFSIVMGGIHLLF
jgi:hypothetical protein